MARTEDVPRGSTNGEQQSWLRPQSVVFTLLAEHVLEHPASIFSGSFIEVLGRVGITEHAVRSTLLRMARRGLLKGERVGRKMYFAMTPRCRAILEDGRQRIWELGAVDTSPATRWTLLTFSMPESWRRKRYDLRSKLTWAGFGPLQNGAWLAPREIDVSAIVAELGLSAHVRAFRIQPVAPTDAAEVIRETFDLDALAERYRSFIAAWSGARGQGDALSLTLRLSTQWLRIIREDPRVPLHLLPADWPAVEAQRLFRTLHGEHRVAAEGIAGKLLEAKA
ncbi:MAG TPA: PaaX family transcriptional regulator C-terminal domain-containing protein [Polyangiales bacterium]|nr:PaaX family transcriptional regulator C-terminal domain-containing protein [Polyangiales bacterium]